MLKFNWPKISLVAAAIIILFAGIYYYSNYYLKGDRGFSEISAGLRESGELVFDMAGVLQNKLPQSFAGLIEKENAKDFKGAVLVIQGSSGVIDELAQKNETLKLKAEEFKDTSNSLGAKEARTIAEKTSDILSRLVLRFGEVVELERELLGMAKDYYVGLSVNEKTEPPSFIQINAKIAVASNELSSLIGDFAVSSNDLNVILNGQPAVTKDELKIEDVALGQGEEAKNGDTLVVHYVGTLQNGTKFDSSVDRGQPFTFVLGSGNVIKGWEQGMLGMKIGGHRRLTIPPDFGYGARGQGAIPPNSTLIFEIDLLDIK